MAAGFTTPGCPERAGGPREKFLGPRAPGGVPRGKRGGFGAGFGNVKKTRGGPGGGLKTRGGKKAAFFSLLGPPGVFFPPVCFLGKKGEAREGGPNFRGRGVGGHQKRPRRGKPKGGGKPTGWRFFICDPLPLLGGGERGAFGKGSFLRRGGLLLGGPTQGAAPLLGGGKTRRGGLFPRRVCGVGPPPPAAGRIFVGAPFFEAAGAPSFY